MQRALKQNTHKDFELLMGTGSKKVKEQISDHFSLVAMKYTLSPFQSSHKHAAVKGAPEVFTSLLPSKEL